MCSFKRNKIEFRKGCWDCRDVVMLLENLGVDWKTMEDRSSLTWPFHLYMLAILGIQSPVMFQPVKVCTLFTLLLVPSPIVNTVEASGGVVWCFISLYVQCLEPNRYSMNVCWMTILAMYSVGLKYSERSEVRRDYLGLKVEATVDHD